ncbi:hypothetical protein POUND7_018918 [Theobroma cacao]
MFEQVPLRGVSNVNSVSFPSLRMRPGSLRFRVSCAAKPETVNKVCEIVRKQLALPDDSPVTGESKFSTLGADSLDTVTKYLSCFNYPISLGCSNNQFFYCNS